MSNKKFRKWILVITATISLLALIIISCYGIVSLNASGKTFDNVEDVPAREVGLLLATSPITPLGAHNFYFDNRIKAADELYKAGKIKRIIASGGNYTDQANGCDEPRAIRDSLVARGIPESAIILDYDGTRTLNSIVKAKEGYGGDSVILISQKYHNERAIWQAEHFGLNAVGYNAAPSHIRRNRIKNQVRELFARVKLMLDMALGSKPEYEHTGLPAMVGSQLVTVTETEGLNIYYPNYSRIDLVCGKRPSSDDVDVILIAEGAFTGELLDQFKHTNIAGDHVSNGKREKGYKCKRNNGAFVYYNGKPKFVYQNYSDELDSAAAHGGMGVAQEMMIHQGKEVPHTRVAKNRNEFRALCMIDGKVAVADSKGTVAFGDFIKSLLNAGATEALYLDMGAGWNYSWYRAPDDSVKFIHPVPTRYATNWVVFYR